jgi:hypothetical protein
MPQSTGTQLWHTTAIACCPLRVATWAAADVSAPAHRIAAGCEVSAPATGTAGRTRFGNGDAQTQCLRVHPRTDQACLGLQTTRPWLRRLATDLSRGAMPTHRELDPLSLAPHVQCMLPDDVDQLRGRWRRSWPARTPRPRPVFSPEKKLRAWTFGNQTRTRNLNLNPNPNAPTTNIEFILQYALYAPGNKNENTKKG